MDSLIVNLRTWGMCLVALIGWMISIDSANAQCACGGARYVGGAGGSTMAPGTEYMMGALQNVEADAIYLTINVPEDTAPLRINNDPTMSVGATRYFVIRHLEPGRTYSFEVVAERANAAGVAMEEIKVFKLPAGSSKMLSLNPIKRKGDPDARTVEGEETGDQGS